LLEVGEYRVGFDQVFVRLGFAGVAWQALDTVDRKGPTPTSESGTLHRWNDEAYSPPVVHMATGFGDLTNECESCLLICRRLRIRKTVFYGSCARETSGSAGYSFPVRQPAYSCHPNSFGDELLAVSAN
jgi:hypothetical protein